MKRIALTMSVLLCGALAQAAPARPSKEKDYWERARDVWERLDPARIAEDVRQLYEQAKAGGESVPADILEWARDDLGRAGRWEYRVAVLDGSPAEIERALNDHGRDRWECLSLTREKGKWVAVLKRPMGSRLQMYLGYMSVGDMLRLLGEK